MFEGWVSELLAGYLGHFVDVQKDQLRVSLWSGAVARGSSWRSRRHMHAFRVPTALWGRDPLCWPSESVMMCCSNLLSAGGKLCKAGCGTAWKTGLTLEDVRLKVEAFDYLQLPLAVKEGVAGKLQIQVHDRGARLGLHTAGPGLQQLLKPYRDCPHQRRAIS